MAQKNNARITDVNALIQAGINPKTGLPAKMGSNECTLVTDIARNLSIIDRQDALNRYVWTGLPEGLTADLIERILYYKAQAILFYMESDDKFYFLPYALDGSIDCYGRYLGVTPIPFGGGATTDASGKERPWIQGLVRKPVYTIDELLTAITEKDYVTKCVIFRDYSNGISQTNIPRASLQQPIIETMAKCIPYMRTALSNSTGVTGVKVQGQEEAQNVSLASAAIENAALTGEKYIPIISGLDLQDLTGGNIAKAEEFLLAMQSLDNFRLAQYGIDNGGIFSKKAHMLQSEQDMNSGSTGIVYNDGLALRQYGCILANLLFGTSMWCEASENVVGLDKNMDGEVSDEQDGQLPTDHPEAQTTEGGNE